MMIARCNDDQFNRINTLEEELNGIVVAYAKPPVLADLSDAQLAKLRALENQLNLTLLVYRPGPDQ